ncbi:HEAT repeat domain-containing protein [Nannocystis punicea]|uniref:HEAT repeat domain-containing protein n=1 Tax=Nannocystis punicea TaxID=2995304 RepID=A0ABY7H509_9BACT|nr:HEAT repeat domain-containing protein [Nannocystis poenicansa]WAS94349.1 HEAT repeat domain-containing protein [Nannocystis poenicansa]
MATRPTAPADAAPDRREPPSRETTDRREVAPPEAPPALSPDRREHLARAVADAGFTPGRTDLRDVVELLGDDEELAVHAERALLRAGAAAAPALLRRLPTAEPPLRPRLVRVLGRLPADPAVDMALQTCLDDHDPKTRRNAIGALGKRGGPGVAAALLARARAETSLPHLRSLVEALGKIGDDQALAWLEGQAPDDPELQRLTARARLMLARSLGRGEAGSAIDLDATAAAPRPLVLGCRPGLEPLLVDALGPAFAARVLAPGRVAATLRGPLRELLAVRLWTEVGLPLPPLSRGTDLFKTIAALLTGPEARLVFETYTKGQPRYRLAWARGGHRRALVWQVASAAAALWPELVNDPRETTWEVVIDDAGPIVRAELRPRRWSPAEKPADESTRTPAESAIRGDPGDRELASPPGKPTATREPGDAHQPEAPREPGDPRQSTAFPAAGEAGRSTVPRAPGDPGATRRLAAPPKPEARAADHAPREPEVSAADDKPGLESADPRFAYRSGDVPAASHPTIAAALARLAEVRPDDVVWDPFVGSGLELCERGLLGPAAALLGTDVDPRALAVAAANLRNAGLQASLTQADATTHRPAGVTLIVTNPPMGRRVHRGDVAPLLTAFVANAAAVLAPGGRLAWISPLPRVTDPAAQAAGLVLRRSLTLDMGGFSGQLQRWDKPLRPQGRPRRP